MQTIKIFLASSVVEFRRERQELAAFVSSINNKSVKRDIFLEMRMCEDLSNAMALERKQNEYNEYIKDSDYLLMLFGKTVGQYTIEEFDVAWEHFQKHGKPKIFTYFREFPQGEQVQESVLNFMERLDKQLGHYYSKYTDLGTVKADFLQVIFESALELQDGHLLLDEQQVLELENVPFYKGGQALQQKRERKKALDEEYAALMPRLAQALSEDGISKRKEELERERGALQKAIDQMETDMFQERQEMVQKRQLGMHMNWREKKAAEWVDKGDYESAKNILRDVQWEEEVRQSEKRMKLFSGKQRQRQLVEIRRYIFGKRVLISYIKITGLNQDSVDEIKSIYENITEKAVRYQMEQKVLQEYAEFLMGQNCSEQGIAVAEKLRQCYKNDEKTRKINEAELLLRLADLYYAVRQLKKSKQCISEALEIIPLLYNDLEREGLTALANGKMAGCLRAMRQVKEAEKWSRDALEISVSLSEQNQQDGTLRWILGKNMFNYAVQMKCMAIRMEAEKSCQKSVGIFEDLAGNYPGSSWCSLFPDREGLAGALQECYLFLAGLAYGEKQKEERESLYRKALEIGRSLAASNPRSNERRMAFLCRNLAKLLEERKQDEEVEGLYRESRQFFKSLFDRDPQRYRDEAARSCLMLGDFLERNNAWVPPSKVSNMKGTYGDFYREALSFYSGEENKGNKEILAMAYYKTAQYRQNTKGAIGTNNIYYKRAFDIFSYLAKNKAQGDYEYMEAKVCLAWAANKSRLAYQYVPPEFRNQILGAVSWEGWLESKRFEYDKIEPLFRQALDIFIRLNEKIPAKELQWNILLCYEEWGTVLWKLMYRVEEADGMYEKACEIAQQFETDDTYVMRVSDIYLKRAMTLEAMDRTRESGNFLRKWRNCEEHYGSQEQRNNQEENQDE